MLHFVPYLNGKVNNCQNPLRETKGLKKSIKIKNELFYSGDRERYKLYRNKIALLFRTSKKNYHNFFELNITLNEHFASVGHRLASKIPYSHVSFSQYLPTQIPLCLGLFCPRISGSNKRYSFANCSRSFESSCCNYKQVGIYPSKLKHAKIIPVFKSGDELDPNNYRPISLLLFFNRIFDKLMCSSLKSFLDKHDVLYHSQ